MSDGKAASVPFFDRTFEETLDLLLEARGYVAAQAAGAAPDTAATPDLVRLVASCETMRLTARLTQVMAWLLVQKAVHAGEMTPAEAARPERRLAGREICGAPGEWGAVALPPPLQSLLDRSLALYTRVARLDDQVGQRAGRSGEAAG